MTAFLNHLAFEFRTGIRDKQMLFVNYLFPLAFYLMMGFVMIEINPTFRTSLVPAMIVLSIMFPTLMGIPDPLVQAREKGIFRSYKINGVPAASILAIPFLTTVLHVVIVSGIILLTAKPLFDAPLPVDLLAFFATLLSFAFASSGMGTLIGVLSPNTTMTILLSQLYFLPSMLLGGLMVPFSMFSGTIAGIARLLPATHAMNAFNALSMGYTADFNPLVSLLLLILSGALSFLLAFRLFRWDKQSTIRRGQRFLAAAPLLPFLLGMMF
ncbi:MAG: ABC transporter permease [Anaerolineales bacterium]|nr:ABC transporter permease [Anaerolineales bacterium]